MQMKRRFMGPSSASDGIPVKTKLFVFHLHHNWEGQKKIGPELDRRLRWKYDAVTH